MESTASTNPPPDRKTSMGWRLVVAGYSTVAVALVAFITLNGATGTPTAATIGTAGLVIVGLLLPVVGMLRLRSGLAPTERGARYGFAMQAVGLLCLLLGALLIVVVASLSGYLIGAVFVGAAGITAIAGAALLRGHFRAVTSNTIGVACLLLGTALVFSGVGIIAGSDIA